MRVQLRAFFKYDSGRQLLPLPPNGYIHSLQALLDDTFPDDGIVIENETVMLWGKLS